MNRHRGGRRTLSTGYSRRGEAIRVAVSPGSGIGWGTGRPSRDGPRSDIKRAMRPGARAGIPDGADIGGPARREQTHYLPPISVGKSYEASSAGSRRRRSDAQGHEEGRRRAHRARRRSRDAGRRRGASRASECANRSIGSPLKRGGPVSHIWQILTAVLGTLDFPNRGHANLDELPRGAEQTADAFAIRGGAARTRPSTPVRARREMTSSALTRTKCVAPAPRVATRRPCARASPRVPARATGTRPSPTPPAVGASVWRSGVGRGGGRARRRRADGHLPKGRPPRRRQGLQAPGGRLALFPTAYHPNERPEERRAFLDAPVPDMREGQSVPLAVVAKVTGAWSPRPCCPDATSAHHGWSRETLASRLNWKPESPSASSNSVAAGRR